jgi:hypothetical protein
VLLPCVSFAALLFAAVLLTSDCFAVAVCHPAVLLLLLLPGVLVHRLLHAGLGQGED